MRAFLKNFQPDTVLQDFINDPKFQNQMSKEVIKSSCLRSQIMIVTGLFFLFLFLILGTTGNFPKALYEMVWEMEVWFCMVIGICVLILSESILWAVLHLKPFNWSGELGIKIGPYFIALIEVSMLTYCLFMAAQVMNPFHALTIPPILLYGTLFMLLILFQNGWICFFAGALAAVEYFGLSMSFTLPLPIEQNFLSAPAQHIGKSINLLISGGISAFVAWELKKRMINSFNEQYQSQKKRLLNKQIALKQQQELTIAYQRFVPSELLDLLHKKTITDVQLGDHVEEKMSILFSDIRSFTTISEKMTPEETFNFINNYLGQMGPLVRMHRGFIDKYIGDAVMAIFNKSADDAIQASIAMLHLLQDYNKFQTTNGNNPIHIGIGINTGMLTLGTVGEKNRMEGTVISDSVNLASRIEGMTKVYGASILISKYTFQNLSEPSKYSLRIIDQVIAKGKTKPVLIYEVMDGDLPEVWDKKLETLKIYKEALYLYNNQQLNEAVKLFANCIEKNPNDQVPQVYFQRCQQIIKGLYDWNPAFQLEIK